MPPLVTCVCLTTHPKRAMFLPDAIRSYRAQDYPAKELLIVNDGAPLVSRAPDIRIVNLPPSHGPWSIGRKRNAGCRLARGEYLATWDDDDLSLPHRLSAQVAALEAWDADVVLADRMYVADSQMQIAGDCDRGDWRAVMPSALLRRSAVVAAGGYPDASYREDAALLEAIRLLVRGNVCTIQDCDWYVLRRHGDNVTLAFGETNDAYIACGLRGGCEPTMQQRVDAIRQGPGADDVAEGESTGMAIRYGGPPPRYGD